MTWQDFVYRASMLGYPHVKDRDGFDVLGFPGGYITSATDGPAGPRVHVLDSASIVYDMPTEKDVDGFLKRVAPR